MAVFLIGGFLNKHESDSISSDTLFTLLFFGYIWHVLSRSRRATPPAKQPAEPESSPPREEQTPSPATIPLPQTPASPPRMIFSPLMLRPAGGRIILHKQPWSVVEQGQPVGQFRHVPIPAWIRTSDNRHADYAGVAQTPPPEGCVCLEIPDQSELILPPGLVYAIRS
jgi:hypothetical protein